MKKMLPFVLTVSLLLAFFAFGSLFNGLKDSFENDLKASDMQSDITPNEKGSKMNKSVVASEPVEPKETKKPVRVRTKPARTSPTPKLENAEAVQSFENKTESPSVSMTAAPTQTPPVSTPAAEAATPVISTADYAYAPVKVTKSPTGETVYEGGGASFISHAENSTDIDWLIVNPDGTDFIDASALANAMPGLGISGANTDTLTIWHIPLSFNGWYVQAKFYGIGGPVHSGRARITVLPCAWSFPEAIP